MASSSGAKGSEPVMSWPQSRSVSRMPTRVVDLPNEENAYDSEMVPSSLAVIVPILRAAKEIEEDNPRVAYLCRFYAFEKAHTLDPTSSGRGVRQFKTFLLRKLEKEGEHTEKLTRRSDSREVQTYYQKFIEKNILEGEYTKTPEEMANIVQVAAALYDVLKAMVPQQSIDEKTERYARNVESKRGQYEHFNILPLYAVGVKPAIMELPEIKAAIHALRNINGLPMPSIRPRPNVSEDSSRTAVERIKPVTDILDWLSSIFGFQKGNVANQREHLILLLANLDIRNKDCEDDSMVHDQTIQQLEDKIFKNYNSWCNYLRCKSHLRYPPDFDKQQLKLIYIGLYLLIWGEASNIRFMPECICYIFHNMADEMNGILYSNPVACDEEYFLREIITPIYQVLAQEAKRNNKGKASHSRWRNYDDLNEYFWSNKCFKLGWPMNPKADFFRHSDSKPLAKEGTNQSTVKSGKRKPKTNFVEVRTFWHLYRSFDRMWIFFILALQAMIIMGWTSGSLAAFFYDEDVFKSVMSIFVTYAFLNFIRVSLDIILTLNAWRSMKSTQTLRHILKFSVAAMWVVILPVSYARLLQNPIRIIKFLSSWAGDLGNPSLFYYLVAIYIFPNAVAAILFLLPPLRRALERSNMRLITLLMWWTQPKLYIGRGMHEDMLSLLKYALFWIILLVSKLAFSYFVEIYPLVGPTKAIMDMHIENYQWHEFFPRNGTHNVLAIVAIWAPIILVYFMDTQIWYAILSTLIGGIVGAFSHLGEIRTLGMLRSRFESVPLQFCRRLLPSVHQDCKKKGSDYIYDRRTIDYFSQVWNEFIDSMRVEDLISNRDRDLLLVPYFSSETSVVQWPPFLLASKIPIALDMAKDFKGSDAELLKRIRKNEFMISAVIECYDTLRDIIINLLQEQEDKMIINNICHEVETSIQNQKFVRNFKMSGLPLLSEKFEKLLNLLRNEEEDDSLERQIINVLQDMVEIMIEDVMVNGREKMEMVSRCCQNDNKGQRFTNIDISLRHKKAWKEKIIRLHLLLTVKESAINVPQNLDARRRITFFANSLFMNMPKAPKVCNMLSFSVLTPYYKEDVLYSDDELNKENEDGISILFYLRKIYPDEWTNLRERLSDLERENPEVDAGEAIREWASYRGQTLYRTVRGMMYYRRALEIQCSLDFADSLSAGSIMELTESNQRFFDRTQALADLKFTYVVSCQVYGTQKKSKNARDRSCYINILNLMLTYPSLRVAYIDEVEETVKGKSQKVYYSVLVKGGEKLDEEIYRMKLPGSPIEIGEGKPENQNHAIIFTRGEALQTIDMNQDNYLEEAFKMRNVLEEFQKSYHGQQRPTILGLREHIFTGSVSSLAWFMSNQETSFVTIGQRVLANPLRVRFHYGHPDIFDRIFHVTRGGISKASRIINLSEDIFAGFNSTLRGGFVTHHEYIQVGKGRDVGMNQISLFEAKVANGNGEQTLSRDVYRLGRRFDFYRMLSFYFTSVGFYFSSMVTVLTVYVFLYGRLYMVLSGVEKEILDSPVIHENKALEEALSVQSIFQLGVLMVLPMVMEIGLEKGFRAALGDFISMQLQLASVFFTFQLGTKAHYFGRTILHGGSKYRSTGRGFVVFHAKFADNYRMYSRTHFVKGLELFILLIVYDVYGVSYRSSSLYMYITFSMWVLVCSWLFVPFIFNPSGFDWQKTVDDWADWKRWMGNRGGIGISPDKSWESWWDEEQEHLIHTNLRGRVLEILLASRFFVYQYGIVYHLDIAHRVKSLLVYAVSWGVMLIALVILKMVSMGRRRFGTDFQLTFRIVKALLSLGFISVMAVLFVVGGLTIADLFAAFLAFVPTGWALLLIAQTCKGFLKPAKFWDSVKELARGYEYMMGLLIFMPIAILSWFPFVSEFQTRLLFNQAFSRGLQISMILSGKRDSDKSS